MAIGATTEFNDVSVLKTVEGAKRLLEQSASEQDWLENCEKVRDANGGYPKFWETEVILSGLHGQTKQKMGW